MAAATAAATAASVSSVTNAGPAQQQSASVPRRKTRLGLSLSERIKVIEARKMGKSMRQVRTVFTLLIYSGTNNILATRFKLDYISIYIQ